MSIEFQSTKVTKKQNTEVGAVFSDCAIVVFIFYFFGSYVILKIKLYIVMFDVKAAVKFCPNFWVSSNFLNFGFAIAK